MDVSSPIGMLPANKIFHPCSLHPSNICWILYKRQKYVFFFHFSIISLYLIRLFQSAPNSQTPIPCVFTSYEVVYWIPHSYKKKIILYMLIVLDFTLICGRPEYGCWNAFPEFTFLVSCSLTYVSLLSDNVCSRLILRIRTTWNIGFNYRSQIFKILFLMAYL